MEPKQFENKAMQNPDLHGYWAEYFPRYVRMGLVGAVVVSIAVYAHEKYTNRNNEQPIPNQDHSDPNAQVA